MGAGCTKQNAVAADEVSGAGFAGQHDKSAAGLRSSRQVLLQHHTCGANQPLAGACLHNCIQQHVHMSSIYEPIRRTSQILNAVAQRFPNKSRKTHPWTIARFAFFISIATVILHRLLVHDSFMTAATRLIVLDTPSRPRALECNLPRPAGFDGNTMRRASKAGVGRRPRRISRQKCGQSCSCGAPTLSKPAVLLTCFQASLQQAALVFLRTTVHRTRYSY